MSSPASPAAEGGFTWSDLCGLLRHELVCLERVLFRATTLRMYMLAGNPRHLAWAAQELEDATQETRRLEMRRAVIAASIAASVGLAVDAPLSALAGQAPDLYRQVLADLGRDLGERGEQLRAELAVVRRTAPMGQRAVLDQLEMLSGVSPLEAPSAQPPGYGQGSDPLAARNLRRL